MAKTVEELEAENAKLVSDMEILKNKGLGVEAEREKRKELEAKLKEIEDAKTLEAEEKLKKDGEYKTLLEQKDAELKTFKDKDEARTKEIEDLKAKQLESEKRIEDLVVKAIEEIPEANREFVKSMAEKYPITERLTFITDFGKQFIKVDDPTKIGGKVKQSGAVKTQMEKAQEMFDELVKKVHKTEAEKIQLVKLGKVLSGEITLTDK